MMGATLVSGNETDLLREAKSPKTDVLAAGLNDKQSEDSTDKSAVLESSGVSG